MTMLAPMTELEAVNEMLMSIGQAPVSTLAVTGLQDVNIARGILTRVLRYILLYGFAFNTDDDYSITPTIDGYIEMPAGALRVDPKDKYTGYVARTHPTAGRLLWNRIDQSWDFTEKVVCRIVWGTPFDELPESAKAYVAMAAARKFQAQSIGSSALDGYAAEDEQRAWQVLLRDDRASTDTNVFRMNPTLARSTLNRRY